MSEHTWLENQGWLNEHNLSHLNAHVNSLEERLEQQMKVNDEQFAKLKLDATGISQSIHTFAAGQSDKWTQAQNLITSLQEQIAADGQTVDLSDILSTLEAGKAEADAGIKLATDTGATPTTPNPAQTVLPGTDPNAPPAETTPPAGTATADPAVVAAAAQGAAAGAVQGATGQALTGQAVAGAATGTADPNAPVENATT